MADRGLCTREEIPAEAKWAIEDLYKNDDEWEADLTLALAPGDRTDIDPGG